MSTKAKNVKEVKQPQNVKVVKRPQIGVRVKGEFIPKAGSTEVQTTRPVSVVEGQCYVFKSFTLLLGRPKRGPVNPIPNVKKVDVDQDGGLTKKEIRELRSWIAEREAVLAKTYYR